jgi:hypothetical protein
MPPQQVSSHLRCLLLEYLQLTLGTNPVPHFIQELLPALNHLLDLLDSAAEMGVDK